MTVFFIVAFIISFLARILCGAFVEKVSFFSHLLTPLTWVTVGFAVLMIIFIALKIYKEIKK